MHIWYLTTWWIAELMVCEGDLNEFEVRTDVEYGKLLLQYIWSACVFVQEGICRVTLLMRNYRPKLRNPVKDAGDHMPALLNLFNEEAHSPFSILLKLREYCPSPAAMSLSPALLGNTEASRV